MTTKKIMTNADFCRLVNEQLNTCQKLLTVKGKEYAPNEDRLSAFRSAAGLQGCSMAEAAFGMASKHLVSVADMVKDPAAYTDERWTEKLTDSINYLLIIRAIVEEEKKCAISK